MDQETRKFIEALQADIDCWEEAARYWEDPRVLGTEDIAGSKKSAKELAANYRASSPWQK